MRSYSWWCSFQGLGLDVSTESGQTTSSNAAGCIRSRQTMRSSGLGEERGYTDNAAEGREMDGIDKRLDGREGVTFGKIGPFIPSNPRQSWLLG